MAIRDLPTYAAWKHQQARDGFEVVFLSTGAAGGLAADGSSAAVEDDAPWSARYAIEVGPDWRTRHAHVRARSTAGRHELMLALDGHGRWTVDGRAAYHLDGCLDVDLECSALTNALPVHRLGLEIGEEADAPAAYVRALDLTVERLEQRYTRLDDEGTRQRYLYSAPRFDFECRLLYDESGLILDYPGIATRAA